MSADFFEHKIEPSDQGTVNDQDFRVSVRDYVLQELEKKEKETGLIFFPLRDITTQELPLGPKGVSMIIDYYRQFFETAVDGRGQVYVARHRYLRGDKRVN